MGVTINPKECHGKKGNQTNKQTLQKVRPNISLKITSKNVENAIFRTGDEDTSIFGDRYDAGNHCRSKENKGKPHIQWTDEVISVTRNLVNGIKS